MCDTNDVATDYMIRW